ncbi:MAG: ABC transporter ATP-binding protein [Sedimentisphaerales bacterium]|nr:ABC transporter ATP-binding protein [Sedimentisphaerales bacterium]
MATIAVEGLSKRFGEVVAVDGVRFEVGRGEMFGLLGPNGAGKTTTINILCGLVRADGGTVCLDGKTDPTRPDVRASLGVVPQSLALYDELTAQGNLELFGRINGLTGRRLKDRVAACLDLAGLTQRRRDRVGTFSGGMKRRLNLVASLLHEPIILLLDEPTVGVDPQSRNLIFDTIEKLRSQGCTILYTTHYMEEAQRLCDRVAILDHGEVLVIDTVEKLIAVHGGPSHIDAEPVQSVADVEQLAGRAGCTATRLNENVIRFQTAEPMQTLAALNQSGVRFKALRVETANLEDVFLNLTGRRLRD